MALGVDWKPAGEVFVKCDIQILFKLINNITLKILDFHVTVYYNTSNRGVGGVIFSLDS